MTFTLTSRGGLEIGVISYGGIITSLRVPDRHGRLDDVVLGFGAAERYRGDHPYFGALIGRYANRIARARFSIGETEHALAANDGVNHLHGGIQGFDKHEWQVHEIDHGLVLSRISEDGEEGYPGRLAAQVMYQVTDDNALIVTYEATSDRVTPVNLTQHSYFNLRGEGQGEVLDHELWIDADRFTPVDRALIPTGEVAPVSGTPLDFRVPARIGDRVKGDHPQIALVGGFDHNFVLNGEAGRLRRVAEVREPESGRTLTVSTTEPALQLYTGNGLDGGITGKSGRPYQRHAGLCLETQHFPDSPNQPSFPSTLLRPGERYVSQTVFQFGV